EPSKALLGAVPLAPDRPGPLTEPTAFRIVLEPCGRPRPGRGVVRGTRMPASPSRTRSGRAPIRLAITGTPAANASTITRGAASYHREGTNTARAPAR